MTLPRISDVVYVRASDDQRRGGLLGYVSLTLAGSIRLDGLTLRRSRQGAIYVSFPERRSHRKAHPYIAAVNPEVRKAFEQQVLQGLGADPEQEWAG